MSEQFRIGAVYFNGNNSCIRLTRMADADQRTAHAEVIAQYGCIELCGTFRLSDGRDIRTLDQITDSLDLVPGELQFVDGQWVPIPSKLESLKAACCAEKAQPAHVSPLMHDAICAAYEASKTPEPKRAPLPHYKQKTRFNPFKGFKVTYEGEGTEPPSFYSRPEQRMTPESAPMCGSAWLLKD